MFRTEARLRPAHDAPAGMTVMDDGEEAMDGACDLGARPALPRRGPCRSALPRSPDPQGQRRRTRRRFRPGRPLWLSRSPPRLALALVPSPATAPLPPNRRRRTAPPRPGMAAALDLAFLGLPWPCPAPQSVLALAHDRDDRRCRVAGAALRPKGRTERRKLDAVGAARPAPPNGGQHLAQHFGKAHRLVY